MKHSVIVIISRLKYLGNQINYSTLQLTLNQEKEYRYSPSHRQGFVEKIRESFLNGWYGFVDFLYFLLSNRVMLVLITVVTSLIIKYRRKRKAVKAAKKAD